MLCCFKQSRRFSRCQSRTTVPLIRSCFPPGGKGEIDASRSEKRGQLLPASGQSEQNVSSVLTSTPSAVLVHVKTHLYFSFLLHIFVVNSVYLSFIWNCLRRSVSPKWKPHDGGHRSVEWLPLSSCRPLLRHRRLHTAAGGECAPALPCEENRETDATNQKAPPRVCLSSNIPVGDQMTVTFCNNCSAGNSGQMSLKSKGKQSCHCLFCFVFN